MADDAQFVSRAMRIAALSMRVDDPATAARYLQRAVDINPTDVRLLASLSEAQFRSGDREGARTTVERGLGIDPDNPTLHALLRRVR